VVVLTVFRCRRGQQHVYALPSAETTKAWAARTQPGFLFNVKAFTPSPLLVERRGPHRLSEERPHRDGDVLEAGGRPQRLRARRRAQPLMLLLICVVAGCAGPLEPGRLPTEEERCAMQGGMFLGGLCHTRDDLRW
jgi:hypothetical protein